MIVYLNQRNYTQSRYIEKQKEFAGWFANLFKRTAPVKPTLSPSSKIVPKIKGRVGNGDLHGGDITPVVPKINNVNVAGTGVKVNGNMPIQAQAQQYLNSGQVQAAQRNAGAVSRNPNNKKFQKNQQILNNASAAQDIVNAGGNTLVIGAKDTKDITAAINNANNGVVGRVKGGANRGKIINQNAYQGQVATKEVPKQQGTGATAAEIKQAKITQDKFNRFQESQTAQQALKDRLTAAKNNGSLQKYQQQKQVNAVTSVTAQDASRNTKLSVKVNKPATEASSAAEASRNTKLSVKVDNPKPETITPPPYKPQGQSQPQTPPPYKPQGQNSQQQQTPPPYNPNKQQTPPVNNTQGQNNQPQTPSTNTNQANWDKLGWWDKWGKQSAIGLGAGATAIGAGYGIKSMLNDDDE